MMRVMQRSILPILFGALIACGGSSDGDVANKAEATAETKTETMGRSNAQAKADALETSIADAIDVNSSGNKRSGGLVGKKGCDLLTADIVSNVFGIPARELMQLQITGCRYSWNRPGETLEAAVTIVQSHPDEAIAAQWFERATTSRTAQENTARTKGSTDQVAQSGQSTNQAASSMARRMMTAAANKAMDFEDVGGVGEEARMNTEGSIYVRVDNLTFIVSAYKGARAPSLNAKGVAMREVLKLAKQAAAQWAEKTAPQRQRDGIALAKAIVAEL